MTIMEFEDLQKIWDTQNNKPMYVINEEALHRRILSKKNKASWSSNVTEVGLVIVAMVTSTYIFFKRFGDGDLFAVLPGVALLLTAVYVIVSRFRRKKIEKQFDQTMLGDLDHAISNVDFEVKRAKTFIWWYIIPIAIPVFLNMYLKEASLWKWALIIGCFILSYVVVQFGLNKAQLPRKDALQALRKKLMDE